MLQRWKPLPILGGLLIGLIAISYIVAQLTLLSGVARIEELAARQDAQRILDAVAGRVTGLENQARAVAGSEEVANLVSGKAPESWAAIAGHHFSLLGLNAIAILRLPASPIALASCNPESAELLYGAGFDLSSGTETPLPPGMVEKIAACRNPAPGDLTASKGIALLPRGPMMLAAVPVTTTDTSTPDRVLVVFGRYLDETALHELTRSTRLAFDLLPASGDNLPPALLAAANGTAGGLWQTTTARASGEEVTALGLLPSLDGEPALVVRTSQGRRAYRIAYDSTRIYVLLLPLLAAAAGIFGKELLDRVLALRRTRQVAEQLYHTLVEQSADGIVLVDPLDSHILECNESFSAMLGYTSQEALAGLTLSDAMSLPAEQITGSIQRLLQQRKAVAIAGECRTVAGTRVDVEAAMSLVVAEGTEIVSILVHDVTAHKQAQAILARQNRELAGLYELALATASVLEIDALLQRLYEQLSGLIDLDGFLVALYDAGREQINFVYAMENGKPVALEPGMRAPLSEGWLTGWVMRSRQPLMIGDLLHDRLPVETRFASGETRSWLGVPLLAGNRLVGALSVQSFRAQAFDENDCRLLESLTAHVAVAIENARLFEAERQRNVELEGLRQASLRLTSSLELHPVLEGILEYTLHVVQARGAHIFLYDGQTLSFGAALWSDGQRSDRPLAVPRPGGLTASVARSGQRVVIPDVNRHPLFASWQWGGAITGLPLRIGEQVVGVMNVAFGEPHDFDSTELRALELLADQAAIAIQNARLYDEIRRQASELTSRVAERTAELQAANEQLRQLDQLKSQFVSNVSHELRTPLTNIKLYLSLLENGKPEKRPIYLDTLRRETDLLQRLIEDLLNLSRWDLGKVHPECEPLDVLGLVTTLVGDRTALAASQRLSLSLDAPAVLPCVPADRKMVQQVLTNLMTNAINYTPPGGQIAVSVRAVDRDGAPGLAFAVSDTGPGIAPEDQTHIFERFFRGAAARASGVPGTGLGLAICHEIVAAHGGTIRVESEPGRGSTFTVWLPLEPVGARVPEAPLTESTTDAEASPAQAPKIGP